MPPPPPPPPADRAAAAAAAVLPIDAHRDEILRTIGANRVTIICGETGCGKSSRLPLMLLAADPRAKMFVSQPRRIAARGLCDRVRDLVGDEVGLRLGHGERSETRSTRLWFCTTGYLVRLVASNPAALAGHTHLVIDEVHERSVDTEILCLLARRLVEAHPRLRLVLMSATACVELYAGYFRCDPAAAIHVGARRYPVAILYADDVAGALRLPPGNAAKLAAGTAPDPRRRGDDARPPNGPLQHRVAVEIIRAVGVAGSSILVFVAGMADILDLTDKVAALNDLARGPPTFATAPIHSDVPLEDQLAVFSAAEGGVVRVILATNAAESGVTIPDCDVVIDLGTAKEISYNSASHRSVLAQAWISKSSAIQRAGRTGRVRPGAVYRLYARGRFDAFPAHATSEIHRCPLDATVLSLMGMSGGTDLGAAAMLAETVEPPAAAAVDRSFAELNAAGLVTSADPDDAAVTAMGAFVSALGIDLRLGRLVGLGAQLGALGDAALLAAALSAPRSPWRVANPLVHVDPDEYARVATASYLSRCAWDAGLHSEPLALLRLARAFKRKGTRAFCAAHNVVDGRARQLVTSGATLLRRALAAMPGDVAARHAKAAEAAASADVRLDAARVNRLRLLLVWTAGDAVFELARVRSPGATTRVAITGAPLAPATVAALFPRGVEYAFESGVRSVFQIPRSPPDVDAGDRRERPLGAGAGEVALDAGDVLALGFEGRLVRAAFFRGGGEPAADVAYAATRGGLALFLAAAGSVAAGDLVSGLVSRGAAVGALEARVGQTRACLAVVRSRAVSAGQTRALKALLDTCAAVGVHVVDGKTVVSTAGVRLDDAGLRELVGASDGYAIGRQSPPAKQTVVFPAPACVAGAVLNDLPLGARVLASLVGGHRRAKLEVWKDADRGLGFHELKVEVATPVYRCSDLAGDRGGRSIFMPEHTLVKTSVDTSRRPGDVYGVAATMLDVGANAVAASGCTLLPGGAAWLCRALTCFGSDAWTRAGLSVPIDPDAAAECSDLADDFASLEDALAPAPDLVRRLDAIFGLDGVEPVAVHDDDNDDDDDGGAADDGPAAPAVPSTRAPRAAAAAAAAPKKKKKKKEKKKKTKVSGEAATAEVEVDALRRRVAAARLAEADAGRTDAARGADLASCLAAAAAALPAGGDWGGVWVRDSVVALAFRKRRLKGRQRGEIDAKRSVGINHWEDGRPGIYLRTPLPRSNRTRFP